MFIFVHGKWFLVMSVLVMYTMLILVNIGHVQNVDIGQYWSYNIGQYCQSSILKKTILRLVFFKFNLDWSMLVILKILSGSQGFKPIAMASKLLAVASILTDFNPIAMASKYLRWLPS